MVHEDSLIKAATEKEDEKMAKGLQDAGRTAEEGSNQSDSDSGQQ